MSFAGITFPNQKVGPAADGRLMQAILADGILNGCSLDYAGFTLTMSAGNLLVGGRQISHPSSESWAVSSGSKFARLVLTIDLSKTSTVDTFDLVEAFIDYAATADGFAALEQSQINVSGTRYQAEICVVSLGSGGITGIVRQLHGACLRPSAEFLKNLLGVGHMQLSGYQLFDEAPDPATLPEGALVLIPMAALE